MYECCVRGRVSVWYFLSPGKMSTYPELDQQIDFLAAIISEQRTESRLSGTN